MFSAVHPIRLRKLAAIAALSFAAVSTAFAQTANSTLVTTPPPGGMVRGHVPVVLGGHTVGDSGHAAPAGDFVGTTDSQTLTNKTYQGDASTATITPTGGTAASTISDLFADQESVRKFGVLADDVVKAATGVSITSGSPNLHCGNCAFVAADVGKIIAPHGIGTAGGILNTHILSVTSPTDVVLATNASTGLSNASVSIEYVTDAMAKLQPYLDTFTSFSGRGPALYWPGPGTYGLQYGIMPVSPTIFYCSGAGSVTLKLPDGANGVMWQDESYAASKTTNDGQRRQTNCTVDGNKPNQSGSSPTIISRSDLRWWDNILINSAGPFLLFPAKGADGVTCVSQTGNPRFKGNTWSGSNGQAAKFFDDGCNIVSDVHFWENVFNGNNASGGCDGAAGGYHAYQVDADRASGVMFTNNNRGFSGHGCGDLHIKKTASNLVEGNQFDSGFNQPDQDGIVRGVYIETGSTNAWSGPEVSGNNFKNGADAVQPGTVELRMLEISNGSGNISMCACLNQFFSVNFPVKTIVYSGNHAGDVHLNAIGNSYNPNAPAPTDPNIDTIPLFAAANLSDLPNKLTALLNLGIEGGHAVNDTDYSILATDHSVYTASAFTAPRTFTLPQASTVNSGHQVQIADKQQTVGATNTLTIAAFAGDNFQGPTSITLSDPNVQVVFTRAGSIQWTYRIINASGGHPDSYYLKTANNLSDVPSPNTALINLGAEGGHGVSDADYTILSTDTLVWNFGTFTAPRTWTLPAASSVNLGRSIVLTDRHGGVSSTNTLTVAPAAGDTFDARSNPVLDEANGTILIWRSGTSTWAYRVLKSAASKKSTDFAQAANNGSDFASPSTVRGNIGAAASGANGDINSLTGLSTPLPVSEGGTASTSASAARTALGAAALANFIIQTTPGSYTYTPTSGMKMVRVHVCGAGGGGGSGARQASGSGVSGGAGAGGGSCKTKWFTAAEISTSKTYVVGSHGVGGASVTTDTTAGNPGTAGTSSSFGSPALIFAGSGGLGAGGQLGAVSGGGGGASGTQSGLNASGSTAGGATTFGGTAGGAGANATVASPGSAGGGGGGGGATGGAFNGGGSNDSGPGGASGGGITVGGVGTTGGTGGAPGQGSNVTAGIAGTSGTPNATDCVLGVVEDQGCSGAGGYGNPSTAGGNGGNGKNAGGGGGGGSSLNGSATGAGGNGGDGEVDITEYF